MELFSLLTLNNVQINEEVKPGKLPALIYIEDWNIRKNIPRRHPPEIRLRIRRDTGFNHGMRSGLKDVPTDTADSPLKVPAPAESS